MNKSVIISVKPKYANKLLNGSKKYEFRRVAPAIVPISVFIYATSPMKKIVGYGVVHNIIDKNIDDLWAKCRYQGGIEKEEFQKYFSGLKRGKAMEICSIQRLNVPVSPYEVFPSFIPPQNFRYLTECEKSVLDSYIGVHSKMVDFAIEVASKAHRNQVRKSTDIPYISHPFSVGMILSKYNCSEELIIAGILHDTVEDTGITIEYIQENFGERIASIVNGCSEPDKTLPWEERKTHTIEYLRTAPLEVRLVSCADKLQNIRAIASDYEKEGEGLWERFNRGKTQQEWYHRSLVESLCSEKHSEHNIFEQFKEEVEEFFNKTCRD